MVVGTGNRMLSKTENFSMLKFTIWGGEQIDDRQIDIDLNDDEYYKEFKNI